MDGYNDQSLLLLEDEEQGESKCLGDHPEA